MFSIKIWSGMRNWLCLCVGGKKKGEEIFCDTYFSCSVTFISLILRHTLLCSCKPYFTVSRERADRASDVSFPFKSSRGEVEQRLEVGGRRLEAQGEAWKAF